MTLVYDHQHWRDAPSRHGCASPPPRSPPVDGLVPGQRRRSRTCGGRAGVGASCRRGAALCCAATVTSLRPAAGLSGSSWILLAFVVLVSGFTCSGAAAATTVQQASNPVQAPSNKEVYVLAGMIGTLGLWLLVVMVAVALRVTSMWKEVRGHGNPPGSQQRRRGHGGRRSGSVRDQDSPAAMAESAARSRSLPPPATAELRNMAAMTAKTSSTWRTVGSGAGSGTAAASSSVSYSGGSGYSSSGQSLPGGGAAARDAAAFGHAARRSTSLRQSSPSILRLAQHLGRNNAGAGGGHTWQPGQHRQAAARQHHSASQGALPMLSTASSGPAVIRQQLQAPPQSAKDFGSTTRTLDRSPFFTPQSPGTLSKVELRSPEDHRSLVVQSLQFGAAGAGAAATTSRASPQADGGRYENDIMRMTAGRRKLTLDLGKSHVGTATVAGDNGDVAVVAQSPGSAPSRQYLPMAGETMSPVAQQPTPPQQPRPPSAATFGTSELAPSAAANTASSAAATAAPSIQLDLLTPMDVPRGIPMHEAQASFAKSLKDQYASYEDMSHAQHARQASTSSRTKKISGGGDGGTPKLPRSRKSLGHRLGAHFSKTSGLKIVLPGRRHHNSAKDLKAGQDAPRPQLPSPTLPSGSLVTAVDHLREASIASNMSAASMPLPDQQRYIPFPVGTSPHSLSHTLTMQMEASSQELSSSRSKALDL